MDNQRLLTWGLFLMLAWFTYITWVENQRPPAPEPTAAAPADPDPVSLPDPELPTLTPVSELPDTTPAEPDQAVADDAPRSQTIRVLTDVLDVTIDTRGGSLVRARTLEYPISKDTPDELVTLLSPERGNYGAILSGLRGAADSNALYTTPQTEYTLGSGDRLVVPLTLSNDGVDVTKQFTFTRGSYRIDVEQTLINQRDAAVSDYFFVQLRRRSFEPDRSMFDVDSYSFDGPIVYDGDTSEKLNRKDLLRGDTESFTTPNGWVAAIEHHFLSAVVPPRPAEHAFRVDVRNEVMTASVFTAEQRIAPGASQTFETTLFVGPKLQSQLEEIDPKLKLTVDYGILTILSQPMFWLLSLAYDYVKNWGLAIILVTILIKLVFYKLTESSGRSMAKMRNLQPRMKAIQERYKDDRQALSQAMMDLYKREKVNPAAGCLPILIQMPFFLAFYWVLVESVEMRQAPFALWLTDLSSRDPYFILPLIMGAAMLLQQRLNPAPTDPVQARVMQIAPIVFTGFFAFFPSGLVLYWVTNTVLSIAQQWKINRVVAAEEQAQKNRGKKKKKP